MNTYDNEATQYNNTDNEATQFENTTSKQTDNNTEIPAGNKDVKNNTAKGKGWRNATIGAASGLLIGGVATVAMGKSSPDSDNATGKDELSHPEWVDDKIQVATSVNDEMSFDEAFNAAREETGAGGVFEWHGQIYSTYTADEWNSMTAEERSEYGSHFSWNGIEHSTSDVAQHSEQNSTAGQNHAATGQHDETQQNDNSSHDSNTAHTTTNDNDIEVISVNHQNNSELAQNQSQGHVQQTSNETGGQTTGGEDIEILGVVHDDEAGINVGGMTIDGQDVILIDVDNDMTFDYMAADTNGNGQIDQNEITDIQGQNLTVNSLGGFTEPQPTGNMYAANEGADYSNDDIYEG